MNFKTVIPLLLVFSINPVQAQTNVVGYVETSPGICQVEFLSDDNQIYTFTEDCSNV